MKKILMRYVAVMVVSVIVLSIAVGCKKEDSEEYAGDAQNHSDIISNMSEFIYIAESVPLPSNIGVIRGFGFIDDKLYLAALTVDNADAQNQYEYTFTSNIYSINVDGTGIAHLPNYTPSIVNIDDMFRMLVDNDGNIWIAEPDSFIRKLDSTGTELFSLNIRDFPSQLEYISSNRTMFDVDDSGNIYIAVDDARNKIIYVHDSNGVMQFQLSADLNINQFVRMPDGSIAFTDYNDNLILQTIDRVSESYGEEISIPHVGSMVYSGYDNYDILICSNNDVYGYTVGVEPVRLLNWNDIGVINNNIQYLTPISEDRIACTNFFTDNITNESGYEILILSKIPYSESQNTNSVEKTELTLATYYIGEIGRAVAEFNRASPDYHITVIDYSDFNIAHDDNTGFLRLSNDLITGNLPDIMDVSYLPYKEYALRGLLADLYPFIDSDPVYNRSDFIQGAFRAVEIDGGLYSMFSHFSVNTITGDPSVVGRQTGWNLNEFVNVLDSNPEADISPGEYVSGMDFFHRVVSSGADNYIDWETGIVRFDSADFVQLMKFVGTYDERINAHAFASFRRPIMTQRSIAGFSNFVGIRYELGGNIVFKGFPTESGSGNSLTIIGSSLAIIEQSPNKEGAWEFLRTILDKDWQLSGDPFCFPTNKSAFDQRIQYGMEDGYRISNDPNHPQPIQFITQADVDQVMNLIDSCSGTIVDYYQAIQGSLDAMMWNIISEEASSYFNGTVSAEDAVRIIQSKVSIMVSERS